MLQQEVNSGADENNVIGNQQRDKTKTQLEKVFKKKRAINDADLEMVDLSSQSHDTSKARHRLYRNDEATTNQDDIPIHGSSQKENNAANKRRSVSRNSTIPKSQDKQLKKNKGRREVVLMELGVNSVRKQRTLSSMFNHDPIDEPQNSRPPLCLVLTRLPKHFVVSTRSNFLVRH